MALPGTYVTKTGGDQEDQIVDYNLMKKDQSGKETLLFTCTKVPQQAPSELNNVVQFGIYSIKVNGSIVAQKAFSSPNLQHSRFSEYHTVTYYGVRLDVGSSAGREIYDVFKKLEERYDMATRNAEYDKNNTDNLAAVPTQKQAYDFLGQFVSNKKQYS